MGKLGILAFIAGMLAACSSPSRCEKVIDKGAAACVKANTQMIYVDGQPTQQLMSNDEARKQCAQYRSKHIATCQKWPADVLDCAEKEFSAPEEWKQPRCQAILEANYEKSKHE